MFRVEADFRAADVLARAGKTDEVIAAYNRLRREYHGSWIDRKPAERLAKLQSQP